MKPTIYELLDNIEAPAAPPEGPEATTSLELLQVVYRDVRQPLTTRMRAAALAINYEYAKRSVSVNINHGFGSRLEASMEARGIAPVIDAKALAKPSEG